MIEMKLFLNKDIELQVKDHARGKQADVIVLEEVDGHSPCVLKVIGRGKGFEEAEARVLYEESHNYYQDLLTAVINLPQQVRSGVIDGEQETLLYFIDEFIGDGVDLKKQIDESLKPEEYIAMIVKFVTDLKTHWAGGTRTEVMGDFKFENFIFDAEQGLVFVDYFGPKRVGEAKDNGLVFPYNKKVDPDLTPESITFLCGDKKGIAGRLCALTKRNWTHLYEKTRDMMVGSLLANGQEEVAGFILEEDKNNYATIGKAYKNEPIFFDTV